MLGLISIFIVFLVFHDLPVKIMLHNPLSLLKLVIEIYEFKDALFFIPNIVLVHRAFVLIGLSLKHLAAFRHGVLPTEFYHVHSFENRLVLL